LPHGVIGLRLRRRCGGGGVGRGGAGSDLAL